MDSQKRYDVAISFAGEDRKYAEDLADSLTHRGVAVFYDAYEKATLWGKNLYTHLSDLYQHQARYCVMLLSRHYATKVWTKHEREAAQARAFQEHKEYILPVRLDDMEIPGILPTVAYLQWPPEDAESITDAILAKLGRASQREIRHKPSEPHQSITSTGQDGGSSGALNIPPENWQGIIPLQSRYEFVTEITDSIPLGLQLFSFEYGPQGHAKALTLRDTTIVRAEIQFTCRIIDPYKAMFGANEYALNVLQPRFLSHARGILERFSLTRLRAGRQEVARDIVAQLSPQFEELGVRLESVTIGALDQILD